MISKKTRRSTKAVEPLNQFPITAGKGIDVSKPADSLTTVQEIENFDITPSGDLELRKPMLLKQTFASTNTAQVLKAFPLYDPNYRLVVYVNPANNKTWIRIVDAEGVIQPLRYAWTNYYTEEEYDATITEQQLLEAEKPPFDWSKVQFNSLSTASVCTNVLVDVCSSVFKINNAIVLHDASLLPDDTNVYRDIQISYSSYAQAWLVKIVTPLMNTLTQTGTSEDIPFDANQNLDNPYALRDTYNSLAPAVKGALAYTLSAPSVSGDIVISQGGAETNSISKTITLNNPVYNPVYMSGAGTPTVTRAQLLNLTGDHVNGYFGTLRLDIASNGLLTNKTIASHVIQYNIVPDAPDSAFLTFPVYAYLHRLEYSRNDDSLTSDIDRLEMCLVSVVQDNTQAPSIQFDQQGNVSHIDIPVCVQALSQGYYDTRGDIYAYYPINAKPSANSVYRTHTVLYQGQGMPYSNVILTAFINRLLTVFDDWCGLLNEQTTASETDGFGICTTKNSRDSRTLSLNSYNLNRSTLNSSLETLDRLRDSDSSTFQDYSTNYSTNADTYVNFTLGNPLFNFQPVSGNVLQSLKKLSNGITLSIHSGTSATPTSIVLPTVYDQYNQNIPEAYRYYTGTDPQTFHTFADYLWRTL